MSEPPAFFKYNELTFAQMNISAKTIFSPRKAIHTALTFALAMLVLVVSCPVKRLLSTNFSSTSSSTKSSLTNIYQSANIQNNATATCSIENGKTFVVESDISQKHKLPLPFYPSNINNQAGFDINYFLSGINYNRTQPVASLPVSLPLFLQHLRLLI